MSEVLFFTEAAATEVALAGGKGATLARLAQEGLPVPAGCILTTRALAACLARLQRRADAASPVPADALQAVVPEALRQALQQALRQLGEAPHGWAVRSSAVEEDSATASFAGMYVSFVAVAEADLWHAISACWASWWGERAVAYRRRLGRAGDTPRLAVVVQKTVPARSAGVAFTADPLSGDRQRLVINAAAGSGEPVVAGVVEPEQYVLAKSPTLRLLQRTPASSAVLPEPALMALAALCLRLEALGGTPQDVEWVWDGRQCWIVQSRPITTLAEGEGDPVVWSNANLKEVMPGLVSPFTWSLMQPQLEAAMRCQYAQAGYRVPAGTPLLRRIWGRPYFNLSLLQRAAYALYGTTPEPHTEQLGGVAIATFTPPAQVPVWQRLRWLGNALRFSRLAEKVRRRAPAQFAAVVRLWREALAQVPSLERQALLSRLEAFASETLPFLLQHLHLTWAMSGNLGYLRAFVARRLPQARPGLVAELVTGLGEVSSAEQSYRLWALSRLARQSPQVMAFLAQRQWHRWPQALAGTAFAEAWQQFLDDFGHRGVYEVEMANPRWREQPDYLFATLAAYAALPGETPPFAPQVQSQRRQAAERELLRQVAPWWRPWLRLVIRRSQEFSRLRENSKAHLVRLIDVGRMLALAAGRFLVADGLLQQVEEVFLLTGDEVKAALRGELTASALRQRLAQRRLERQRDAALQPPEAFVGTRPLYGQALDGEAVLRGLPSSPGRVTATVRVLRSPREGDRLQPGEILVAPATDPGWTPLFLLAAGLVVETGGYLSHGAIVAREYGIPAVLNVPQATRRIPDGAIVTLDGGEGLVRLHASAPPCAPQTAPR
ncbi:MAG: phosphoenolpyruvate synthase [Candidatus Tectimicrobiota bacterium]|nr:MAG: phosphoenolpyruvate synthase [Candidatus Tectomicrobia bacterium]